jgi:hypothetical protein
MTDPLAAYRRMLTSADDGSKTAWWYLGTTIARPEGFEPIVVNHVETVMIYGATTLNADGYRVPWWEIGLFRDAATGEVATTWTNPLTGADLPAAPSFEEGPSAYTVRRAGEGLAIVDAVQAHAALDSATLELRPVGDKLCVTQTELKTRSFPGPDGRIPDLAEGQAVRSRTVLQFLADRADLAGGASSVPASGFYSFELAAPAWLGFGDRLVDFAVRGLMRKAALYPPLNPRGWADLQTLFPRHFADGRLTPPRA